MTVARRAINQIVTKLATTDPERTLFVGVDPKWDYRDLFKIYETLDIRSDRNPDILGDIQDCPQIKDNTYDLVIMTGVYEYLNNPEKAFNEINRIITQNGAALICLPTKIYYPHKPTVEPNVALEVIKPLRMLTMNITYYKNEPYYLNIYAEKS